MSDITFVGTGWDDYVYWQTQDKKTLKKINSLLMQCRNHYGDK